MAHGLFRQAVNDRGLDADIRSAGLLTEDRAASPSAVEVLAERAVDISDHLSRRMTVGDVKSADLILAMARRHLREAVVLDPGAFSRTYTLKELVRRGRDVGGRLAGERLDEWLSRMHSGRTARDHLGDDLIDDVADPIGEPLRVYEQTANELEVLVRQAVDLIWGPDLAEELPA